MRPHVFLVLQSYLVYHTLPLREKNRVSVVLPKWNALFLGRFLFRKDCNTGNV